MEKKGNWAYTDGSEQLLRRRKQEKWVKKTMREMIEANINTIREQEFYIWPVFILNVQQFNWMKYIFIRWMSSGYICPLFNFPSVSLLLG